MKCFVTTCDNPATWIGRTNLVVNRDPYLRVNQVVVACEQDHWRIQDQRQRFMLINSTALNRATR